MFPLISVIIPAHNSENTIDIAIKSMIMQTYPNLEILIIDDNSTDNTREIAKKFSAEYEFIKYFSLPFSDPHRYNFNGVNINAGWIARNYGFERSKGEWITFQDADDSSLINRIEVQYNLAMKYKSSHVCIDWQIYKAEYVGKKLDIENFNESILKEDLIITSENIIGMVKNSKGHLMNIFNGGHKLIPFPIKSFKFIEKFFFKSWEPYPCAGNNPLVKREVMEKIKFRTLNERIWPSRGGRGADRDFNFAVAEEFKNSISVRLPLYLWRVKNENSFYEGGIGRFIV